LQAVARNRPIIIVPWWWKFMWWLTRLSPGLGAWLSRRHFADTKKALGAGES